MSKDKDLAKDPKPNDGGDSAPSRHSRAQGFTVPLTLVRAREIVAAMVGHVCWEVGAMETRPQSLAALSLAEMVEANRMVRQAGAVEIEGVGEKVMLTACEDRLVAALYVLYHYEPAATNHPIAHDGQKLVDVLPVIMEGAD